MSKKGAQAERRRSRRTYVTAPGALARLDGSLIARVTVRDVSATGAKIALAGPVGDLPEEFVLVLSRDGRAQRRCTMAWRTETGMGLRFNGNASVAVASGDGPQDEAPASASPPPAAAMPADTVLLD